MKGSSEALSMSLRARINNFSKQSGISPQLALQRYFAERFLARIAQSPYAQHLAVKGGTLMGELLGIAQRTTMDIDATVIGIHADEAVISRIVKEIASLEMEDGIRFEVDPAQPGAIRKDDDYGGYSIGMIARFGTIQLPIGIDVTFGDVITPAACKRRFKTMLDNNFGITVLAYTVETLIAEKLQTVLKRGEANTRPRDFYDLHMLSQQGDFDSTILKHAFSNTIRNRHSEAYCENWKEILSSLRTSAFQRDQWLRYCNRYSYAKNIDYDAVIRSIGRLLQLV